MLNSAIPPKFLVPFASSAGSANVRTVPQASQISIQAGAASLTDGFPPLNLVPVSAGGVPPFGQDMNGILRQITQWTQWENAGGAVRYDAAFVSAVGGYPAGATLMSNSGHCIFQNMVEANSTNPNLGGANWFVLSCVWSATPWQAAGSANAQTVMLNPAPISLAQLINIPLLITSIGITTGATTLNINGLGAVPIQTLGSVSLGQGSLITGTPFEVIYNGSVFVLTSMTATFVDPNTYGLTIQGIGTQGANIRMMGNASAAPNKYLRVVNGSFQVLNSAYTSVPLSLDDTGNLTITGQLRAADAVITGNTAVGAGLSVAGSESIQGTLTVANDVTLSTSLFVDGLITGYNNLNLSGAIFANSTVQGSTITAYAGNVLANNGRLRATYGSLNSGDPMAGVILQDFLFYALTTGVVQYLPNGFIFQMMNVGVPPGTFNQVVTLPIGFPTTFTGLVCSPGAALVPLAAYPQNVQGVLGADPLNQSQFVITNNTINPVTIPQGIWVLAWGK